MLSRITKRLIIGLAALAILSSACSDHAPSVVAPSLRAPARGASSNLISTPTVWDFATLAGFTGPLGNPKSFTITGAGTIVASSPAITPATQIYSKGFELPVGDPERGLGLCRDWFPNGDCSGATDSEVGDDYTVVGVADGISPSLYLDFTGLTAGTTVQSVTLGSLQPSEGYQIDWSADGTSWTLLAKAITGPADPPILTLPVPSSTRFLRFDRNPDGGGGDNYVVQSVTVAAPSGPPGLSIVKTPSTTTPTVGQSVTYSYTVTNTGGVTLTNIVVTDDAGTPLNPSDDFTVGTISSLAPGASVALTATTVPSNASIVASLGSAGPSGFAVLSLGGDASHTNAGINCSAATVNGNVGVASYGKFSNAAPCVENGNFYKGINVTYSGPGTLNGTTITDETLMNTLRADAFAAGSYFAGLPATPSVQAQFPANGNIGSNLTVTGTPGLNVVKLTGLTLNGNLTLSGPAGTQFVLDISGAFNLHSGNITTAGGVGPFDVIYNITDPSAAVTTMVPTSAVGVLLAPYNKINSMDSGHFYGEVVGGYNQVITLMSGTRVVPPPPPPPTVTNTATASTTAAGVTVSATGTATVTIH